MPYMYTSTATACGNKSSKKSKELVGVVKGVKGFALYTLYPPGLTVIIYDGFRHTRIRTLFKAQIYLNKNKNNRPRKGGVRQRISPSKASKASKEAAAYDLS